MKCLNATQREWTCSACTGRKPFAGYDAHILRNARFNGRLAVCLECQVNGFTPRDVSKFPCIGCSRERGHQKFDARAKKVFLQKGIAHTLVCLDCAKRRGNLETILRKRDSWKCTCPGTGVKRKHLMTNAKCQLAPVSAGERRWVGKNNGVTQEDVNFLKRSLEAARRIYRRRQ